jgi:signal transduction histidine kinase
MMALKQGVTLFCVVTGFCLVFFYISQKHLTEPWIRLALNPEVNDTLLQSIQNQRKLAKLDPEKQAEYHQQFEETRELLQNMEVLRTKRSKLEGIYQWTLVSLFAVSIGLWALLVWYYRRQMEARLAIIGSQLERLAAGDTDIHIKDERRDVVGRIAAMIARASHTMAKAQQRLKQLQNLKSWQESSRRIAHEIRTPLTAIRLETKKLVKTVAQKEPNLIDDIAPIEESLYEEIGRLGEFTDQFTSFGKISEPKLGKEDLGDFVRNFCEVYADAWACLSLHADFDESLEITFDRRMIRQVIVNLCNNASHAIETEGHIHFSLEHLPRYSALVIKDNGPGLPDQVRERLFEPYTTTKPVGKGMGLGLAISKKIMFDHQGDLELMSSDASGTTFRLLFPKE